MTDREAVLSAELRELFDEAQGLCAGTEKARSVRERKLVAGEYEQGGLTVRRCSAGRRDEAYERAGRMMRRLLEGASRAQVAGEFGVSVHLVAYWQRKTGVGVLRPAKRVPQPRPGRRLEARLVQLVARDGLTVAKAARLCDVTTHNAYRALARAGVKLLVVRAWRNACKAHASEVKRDALLLRLWRAGTTQRALAVICGVNVRVVERAIARAKRRESQNDLA